MTDKFDEKVLKTRGITYDNIENYKAIEFHFKIIDNKDYFFCELNDERLNAIELKHILTIDEDKKKLNSSEISLIDYIIHRITGTQSYYKIMNDYDLIFGYLKKTKRKINYKGDIIVFSNDDYKLNIELKFNEKSNIVLDIKDDGEFIFGLSHVFFFKNNSISKLSDKIPIKFYREIVEDRRVFSVDSFFTLKKTYLETLKTSHNVSISKEVEDVGDLNLEEKIAPLVLKVDKTAHFVIIELVYKIGDESFKIDNYKTSETVNWLDKKSLIKIAKEDNKLVKYISDITICDDIFDKIFDGTRVKYKAYMKVPYRIMLPIFQLNNFMNKAIPQAEKLVTIEYKGGEKIKIIDMDVKFYVDTNLDNKKDLFSFVVKFKIGNEYFNLAFIKELMEKTKKYVQLKDGTTVNVENIRELNKWLEFLKKYEFCRKKDVYNTNVRTVLEIDEFLEDFKNKEVKSNQAYRNLIQEIKEKKPIEKIELPECVDHLLRDYQKEGIYWLHFLKKYEFGGILADEMGLGKTIQALTILKMEKENGVNFVICPKTLIHNWENEINKFFPDLSVLIIDGDNERRKKLIKRVKRYNIVITSYSMLQKDYKEYLKYKFNFSVLDEAHYVKNVKTLSAKAVRLIDTNHKILLTGTPLENNLDELYGTFDLVMPDFLGTKADFNKDYASKIERNNMIALELLQAKIRPFILRRLKKDVLKELPAKQERIVYSEMTNKQVAIYTELLKRVKGEVTTIVDTKGFDKSRIEILSALLKLRQICNHPVLLDKSFKGESDLSGKHAQFLELLTEVVDNGEKVLVFSQFTSMLDIFEEDLEKMGIVFCRLDGSTKNRQELVDNFNEDDSIKVFLISLKAGGVGLNLTGASSVFLYDPWWNPMAEKQAQDRAHRMGQKKTVNVYKFITKNSIEEKILKLQERKGNLFENLIVRDKGFIKKLEWEDLLELFD